MLIKNILQKLIKSLQSHIVAKSNNTFSSYNLGSMQFFINHAENKNEIPRVEFITYI